MKKSPVASSDRAKGFPELVIYTLPPFMVDCGITPFMFLFWRVSFREGFHMKKLRMTRTFVALLVFSILIYLTSFSSIAAPATSGAGTSGLIVIVQGGELLYREPYPKRPFV